jgi:hypothetical protein
MREGGFDVVIGNPPYFELAKLRNQYSIINLITTDCGNIYAPVIEVSQRLNRSGRMGFIVPLSIICTDRTRSLQNLIKGNCSSWYASYDTIPGRLFGKEVEQRLTIMLNKLDGLGRVFTTTYLRFTPAQRDFIFDTCSFFDVTSRWNVGLIPRTNYAQIIDNINLLGTKQLGFYHSNNNKHKIYVHRIVGYFTKAFDFIPHFSNERDGVKKSEDYKEFNFNQAFAPAILAILNSNIFYWWWHSHSDGFHCGYRDVLAFPLDFSLLKKSDVEYLTELSIQLMTDLTKNSEIKIRVFKATGRAELQEFSVAKSKAIIDKIDLSLGSALGFSKETIDYLINYDIKFRGAGTEE